MYQLWFYITVPGTGFETPRVHSQIAYRRERSGSDRVTPFLTVDYTVGMLLNDELILTGRVDEQHDRSDERNKESWNYTVVPLVNQSHAHRSTSPLMYLWYGVAAPAESLRDSTHYPGPFFMGQFCTAYFSELAVISNYFGSRYYVSHCPITTYLLDLGYFAPFGN